MDLRFSAQGPLVTRVASQRAGALLAWLSARLRLTPNQVTSAACLSSFVGVAAWVAYPGAGGMLAAFVLLQLGYALDCADGQLARATGLASKRGQWWDVSCDYFTLLALGLGAAKILLDAGLPQLLVLLVAGVYTGGRMQGLFSSTLARQWRGTSASAAQRPSPARTAYMALIDTPVQLAVLVLLRGAPEILLLALLIFGLMALVHGLYVGLTASAADAQ